MGMVQDLAYEKAHTADFLYMTNGGGEKLSEILSSREEVAEYEESPAMYLQSVKYKKRGETEEKEFAFVLGKLEEERKIGILPEPGRSIKKMPPDGSGSAVASSDPAYPRSDRCEK